MALRSLKRRDRKCLEWQVFLSPARQLSLPFVADSYPERRDSLACPWGHPPASFAAAARPWDVQRPSYDHISKTSPVFFNTFDLPRTRRAMHLRCSHSLTPNFRGCCGASPLASRARRNLFAHGPPFYTQLADWPRAHMGPVGFSRGGNGALDRGPLCEGVLGRQVLGKSERTMQDELFADRKFKQHPYRLDCTQVRGLYSRG